MNGRLLLMIGLNMSRLYIAFERSWSLRLSELRSVLRRTKLYFRFRKTNVKIPTLHTPKKKKKKKNSSVKLGRCQYIKI